MARHNGGSYSERLAYEVGHPPRGTYYKSDGDHYAARGLGLHATKYKLPASEAEAGNLYVELRILTGFLHPFEQECLEALGRIGADSERSYGGGE